MKLKAKLKAEAIKWVRFLTKYWKIPDDQKEIRFQQARILEQFFNLTKEDLK